MYRVRYALSFCSAFIDGGLRPVTPMTEAAPVRLRAFARSYGRSLEKGRFWRAGVAPARLAGGLKETGTGELRVCREADWMVSRCVEVGCWLTGSWLVGGAGYAFRVRSSASSASLRKRSSLLWLDSIAWSDSWRSVRGLLWLRKNSLLGLGISDAPRDQEVRLPLTTASSDSIAGRSPKVVIMPDSSLSGRSRAGSVFQAVGFRGGRLVTEGLRGDSGCARQNPSRTRQSWLQALMGGPKAVSIPFALKDAGGLREEDLRSSRDRQGEDADGAVGDAQEIAVLAAARAEAETGVEGGCLGAAGPGAVDGRPAAW